MIFKFISFIFLSLIFLTDNADAISLKNIDLGGFMFRLELRADNTVDRVSLDLIFLDGVEFNEVVVFNNVTITDAGQTFVAVKSDLYFPEASELLTNGVLDWIKVVLSQTPRDISIKGTEPYLLIGDYTGNSGIDLAGLTVESIELHITDTDFRYGSNTGQGPFTDIMVEGEVSIITGPVSLTMFAASYGSYISDGNYSIFSDADGDGDVDGIDLSLFSDTRK